MLNTGTISPYSESQFLLSVEPKCIGKSGWYITTYNSGYNTVLDYYWGYFRQNVLMQGPIH